jgi:TolA-binding protein
MKVKAGTRSVLFALAAFFLLSCGTYAFSQPSSASAEALSKRINSSANNHDLFINFQAAQDEYLKDNRYNDFVDLLKGLAQKKNNLEPFSNYFTGLTRYLQMKSLEEKQAWDEYFSQGNNYRDEISGSLDKVVRATDAKEALNIYARLVLWRFHHDQQDVFFEQALKDLLSSAVEYARSSQDLAPVKTVADTLVSYGEKSKAAQLYKIYIDKMIAAGTKAGEIKTLALGFLNEGNIELAQTAFDSYVKKVVETFPAEEKAAALKEAALLFAWKEPEAKDGQYAEKIFKAMEDAAGKDVFDEELLYLRAYNLEKIKEFASAKNIYLELLSRFPQTKYAQISGYKVGLIALYVGRDESLARQYLEKTSQADPASPLALSSLYQLGILTQWEDDLTRAQAYYDRLIENAGGGAAEIVSSTKERISEIKAAKPLDSNIRASLDMALKPENSNLDMSKVQIKISPASPAAGEEIIITSSAASPESGCTQVVLDYVWAGDLGKTKPSAEPSGLAIVYSDPGTKIINLVVMCPYGVLDRSIDIIDVK